MDSQIVDLHINATNNAINLMEDLPNMTIFSRGLKGLEELLPCHICHLKHLTLLQTDPNEQLIT